MNPKARKLDRELERSGVKPVEKLADLARGTADEADDLLEAAKHFRTGS